MRKSIVIILLMAFVAIWCHAQDAALKTGAVVAAKWSDGYWYRGKISAVKNSMYTVVFDDGDSSVNKAADVKLLPDKPKVAKGQRVFAYWEGDHTFYLGTVQEVRKTGIVVAWDDGSDPLLVAFGYFGTDVSGLAESSEGATATSTGKTFPLWLEGSRVGEVGSDGQIWIDGNLVGEIESDGKVWEDGSVIGEIDAKGRIWEDGSIVGQVDSTGKVWKGGSIAGEISADGRIWKGGSIVGEAPGLPRPWAAVIYYFFFLAE